MVHVDAEVISRCLNGDNAAWEEIVRLHTKRVYNFCYRFTGSWHDAEDLTQEVFMRVYKTLKSYNAQEGSFSTWLMSVTRNLLVDHYRKHKKEAGDVALEEVFESVESNPSRTKTAMDQISTNDKIEMVRWGLSRLSPDLREAVVLRDCEDMRYDEIATVLHVPEGTVKSRINRGRIELARILERKRSQVEI
ncbi:MAG: sigma-70 family RNA polymerase sigma factor [Acidobacteriia bacterium]|nr:sigma-70 family RNA polymerase sigma factor [Terriglobia bacterium]